MAATWPTVASTCHTFQPSTALSTPALGTNCGGGASSSISFSQLRGGAAAGTPRLLGNGRPTTPTPFQPLGNLPQPTPIDATRHRYATGKYSSYASLPSHVARQPSFAPLAPKS